MKTLSQATANSVAIVMLPSRQSAPGAPINSRYDRIPGNVLHLVNTLRNEGLHADVLNYAREFHGVALDPARLRERLAADLGRASYRHLVVPLSYTAEYCFFVDVSLSVLQCVAELPEFRAVPQKLFTGRIINPQKLRSLMPFECQVFDKLYDEQLEITSAILGRPAKSPESWLLGKKELERDFGLGRLIPPLLFNVAFTTQRGCLFQCTFCERELIWPEKKVSRMSDQLNREYIAFMKKHYGLRRFTNSDPLLNSSQKNLREIAALAAGMRIKWISNARIDLIKREDLQVLKAAGCRQLLFGLESLDKDAQRRFGKLIDEEKIKTVIRDCHELGMKYQLTFIVGGAESLKQSYAEAEYSGKRIREQEIIGSRWRALGFKLRISLVHALPGLMPTAFYYILCMNRVDPMCLTFTEGTALHQGMTDDRDYAVTPRFYRPFRDIFKLDLEASIYNHVYRHSLRVAGRKVYSIKDLFQVAAATGKFGLVTRRRMQALTKYQFSKRRDFDVVFKTGVKPYVESFLAEYEQARQALHPVNEYLDFSLN